MSGIMMALLSEPGARVANPLPISNQSDFKISPNDSSASVSFNTDGTMSRTGDSGSVGNWYNPTTASIGSSHWVRLVLNSGSATNLGEASGTIFQLSSNRQFGQIVTGTGIRTGNFTAQIATDSGMTNIVGTATFSITAEVEV